MFLLDNKFLSKQVWNELKKNFFHFSHSNRNEEEFWKKI